MRAYEDMYGRSLGTIGGAGADTGSPAKPRTGPFIETVGGT
ncbi:MAG: hypothetical protein ACRDP9_25505 [Kribbellaceae bacterium]